MKLFLDGKILNADKALLDSLLPGVLPGKGVFETMRVMGGEIWDLQEHLDRLFKGLRFLKMRFSYTRGELIDDLRNILQQNHLQQARARLAVWQDDGKRRVAMVCQPFNGYPRRKYRVGFHAVVSEVRRRKTRGSHLKSLNYGFLRRALTNAQDRGYDEAILLNNRKELAEGARTNIFFVKKDILFTPPVKAGCINGITRRQVIQCARRAGVPFKTVRAPVRVLLNADEAFCTSALMGVMPLTYIFSAPIGSGKPGPVTKKLSDAYCAIFHSSCPS